MIAPRSFEEWIKKRDQQYAQEVREEARNIAIHASASAALLQGRIVCLMLYVPIYFRSLLLPQAYFWQNVALSLALLLLATLLSEVWSIWYSDYRSRDEA